MGMSQPPHGLLAVVEILFPSGALESPRREKKIGQAVINKHATARHQLNFPTCDSLSMR